MSDKPENQPVSQPPEPEKAPLSDKKKRALLNYMCILFCAAFILVLLSFLIQLRDSNSTITQLSQTSTNAMTNAQRLQEENSTLITEADEMKKQITSLEEERGALQDQVASLEAERDDLQSQLDEQQAQEEEFSELKTQLEEAQQSAEAYQLLAELLNTESLEEQKALLTKLEPLKSVLDSSSQKIYEEILQEVQKSEE